MTFGNKVAKIVTSLVVARRYKVWSSQTFLKKPYFCFSTITGDEQTTKRVQTGKRIMRTVASVKRTKDFAYDGEYVVTFTNGQTVRIYRNASSGLGDWRQVDNDRFLGFTKTEALQTVC